MKKYIIIGAVLAASLVQADVITPVAQARIGGDTAADSNAGSSGHIDIKEGGGQYTRYATVRFDLSAISGTVTSATLDMLVKNGTKQPAELGNFRLFGVVDSAANGWAWTTDMTWNEAAAKGMWTATEDLNTAGLLDPKLVDLGSTAFAGGGSPYSYNVTAIEANLISLMNADTDNILTIIAAYDANDNVGVRDPLSGLTSIEYTAIPEPSTLGLIALVGGGLVAIRRNFVI